MEYPSFSVDEKNNYEFINMEESLKLYEYRHVAHCCLYSPHSFSIGKSLCRAYISMQMRSDGYIGFPGGCTKNRGEIVSESAEIVDNLNRELLEEINLNEKYFADIKNYMFTQFCREKKEICHFFGKEISVEDFFAIERNAFDAEDFGVEVFGLIRVPLIIEPGQTWGFPVFLSNQFAGCSKLQLLHLMLQTQLMSYDEIKDCLSKSKNKH